MPRQLAALICIIFIVYLFWMDRNKNEGVSNAVWIPFTWMFFAGSRYLSQWIHLGATVGGRGLDVYLEGDPINSLSFFALIIGGFIVLLKRRIDWPGLVSKNIWLCLFFAFGAVSIVWSDFPFVSFKRLIKALGNVIMGTLILTEARPLHALGVILKRLSFLFLPLSILFIKYYPEIGRSYHVHSGIPLYQGVATQKNGLGQVCLILGTYFCWSLLVERNRVRSPHFIILPMIGWLFYMSNSTTSLICMAVALILLLASRLRIMVRKPSRLILLVIICAAGFLAMEYIFELKSEIITSLGKDETLTTRTPMWEDLSKMVTSPVTGCGYESFWLGDRQRTVVEKWGISLSAHNGYLETYLNLGLIGVFLLICWFVGGIVMAARHLRTEYEFGIFMLCFILVTILYNYTEATFYGVSNMWTIFILCTTGRPELSRCGRN
jgi:exopolysaccharide production protein ExoQ